MSVNLKSPSDPARRRGGFKVLTVGGTLQPRRIGFVTRLRRAWTALTNEPKPSPFSRPRIEGDTIFYPPCEAFPTGKVLPRRTWGRPDPTPGGSAQGNVLAEAMRKALGRVIFDYHRRSTKILGGQATQKVSLFGFAADKR